MARATLGPVPSVVLQWIARLRRSVTLHPAFRAQRAYPEWYAQPSLAGRRRPLLALLLVGLFGVTAARHQLISGDPAAYVELAHSLASGAGYSFDGVPHTYYPPGLPLALTPVVTVAGMNVAAAQVYVAVWAAVALLIVFAYLERRGDSPATGITLFLVLSSGFYAVATTSVRSEPLYLVAVFLLLLGLERRPVGSGATGVWLVSLAVVGAAVPAIRTVGVAMLAALGASVLQSAVRARRRQLPWHTAVGGLVAAMLGGLAFVVLWQTWILHHGMAGSYAAGLALKDPHVPDEGPATLADIVSRVVTNAATQSAHLGELASNVPWLQTMWSSPVVLLLCPIILMGWAQEFRRALPVAAWYVLFYVGIILVWPYNEGTRFLVPILPLLAMFAVRGAPLALPRLSRMLPGLSAVGIVGAAIEIHAADVASRQRVAVLGFWIMGLVTSTAVALRSRERWTSLPKEWRIAFLATLGAMYGALGVRAIGQMAWANVAGTTRQSTEVIRGSLPWIAANTGPDDRIMTQWPWGVHFYTRRHAVLFPVTADPHELCVALAASRPTYLLVTDTLTSSYYRPTETERFGALERTFPGALHLVFQYGMGRIYRVGAAATQGHCGG